MQIPARLRTAVGDAASAGPELFLAFTCLLALFLPEVEKRLASRIGMILGLEFVGLHAFGFLGGIVVAKPAQPSRRALRVAGLVAVCVIYSLVVYDWGPDALVSFWVVTISTYAGFFFHDAPEHRKRTLVLRWSIAFGLFFLVGVVTGLTAEYFNLRSPRKEFLFGAIFFAALGFCDLIRLYDRIAARQA
jgi:hypothetical protein